MEGQAEEGNVVRVQKIETMLVSLAGRQLQNILGQG